MGMAQLVSVVLVLLQAHNSLGQKIDFIIEEKIDNKIQEFSRCYGVIFDRQCFWLPNTVASMAHGQGLRSAANLCRYFGGTLVDIESRQMYEALYSYIQRAWNLYVDEPEANYVEVWLASRYENGRVRSSTGGATFARWYRNYPTNDGHLMGWSIPTNSTRPAAKIGVWNWADLNYNVAVPFCRMNA